MNNQWPYKESSVAVSKWPLLGAVSICVAQYAVGSSGKLLCFLEADSKGSQDVNVLEFSLANQAHFCDWALVIDIASSKDDKVMVTICPQFKTRVLRQQKDYGPFRVNKILTIAG